MATVQQPAPPAPAKHEVFVENQLRRARIRIRAFDTVGAMLGLIIGTFVYGLGMVLLDRWLELPSLVRQLAFGGYLVIAVLYLTFFVVRPLCRRINLHYAARLVEQTVPGAKNSLVNWLDVRDQRLPVAIRGAVGMRAAKDLSRVDLESAISARRVLILGGFALVLFLSTVTVLTIFRPGQFFSLLDRAFSPFGETTIATRTHLILVQPADGNTVVPVNQAVSFVVRVEGRVPDPNQPDALKLLFRTNQADPVYQERLLEGGDADREWTFRLPAFEVHNGFWYKLTGGDAETPEYRVDVRSSPLVTRWEVFYHYRPYLCRTDRRSEDPNLEAPRGTEVRLIAHTNRRVQQGFLHIDGEPSPLASVAVENHPEAMAFHFVLQKDGSYRVRFTSTEDERSGDSIPYKIKATPDLPPHVVLTQPGKDVTLPADGILSLEGYAEDDYGVTNLTLRLRLKDGADLQPKVYRQEDQKSFRFEDGSYPRRIDYRDFLELAKLKDANGAKPALKPGTVIEYWLEATDNCDYPAANVARTKETFTVTIAKPQDDPKKQEQARQQAEKKQQEHQKKQDQQLKQENQKRQEQRQQEQANNQNPNGNPDPNAKNGNEKPKDPKQQQKDQQLNQQAKRLNDEIGKKEEKGQAKEDKKQQPKGEGKGDGQPNQPNNGKNNEPRPKGEGKNQPKDNDQAGASKSPGQNNQGQPTPPSEKGQPKPEPKGQTGNEPQRGTPGKEGGDKGQGAKKPQPGLGQAPGGKKDAGDKGGGQAGQQKGPGNNGQPSQQPGSGKNEGQPGASPKAMQGEPKGRGRPGNIQANQQDTGAAKGDGDSEPRGDVKHKSTGNPSAQTAPGTPKSDAPLEPGQEPRGGGKSANAKQGPNSGGAKGEGSSGSSATREDAAKAAKDLLGGDARKREEAIRQLQNMARNAKNPQVRKDARQSLDENGPRVGSEPKGNENNPANDATQGNGGEGKPSEDQPNGNGNANGNGNPNSRKPNGSNPMATSNDAPKSGKPEEAEGNPKGEPGKPNTPGQPGGQTPGRGNPNGGPGGAPQGGERPEIFNPQELDPAKTTTADLRHKLRAGELQLKKFKEEVTPEMLKEMKMTKTEYEQFLADYNRRLKEGWGRLHEMEKTDRPLTGNAPRSNPGIVRGRPNTQKPTDPIQSGGPLLAPSEFRKQYQEFTQDLSKLRPRGEKK